MTKKIFLLLKMYLMKIIYKGTKNLKFHQNYVAQKIKLKRKNKEKITIGFFILYPQTFPSLSLIKALEKIEGLELLLIPIPDMMREPDNRIKLFKKIERSFKGAGRNLIDIYDKNKNEYIDISEKLDLVCISNPYDCLTHKFFTIEYLKDKDILPFYINYGFNITNYSKKVISQKEFAYFWKIFVETKYCMEYYILYSTARKESLSLVGYAKMDALAEQLIKSRKRKKIVLAPHHTLEGLGFELQLSNFIRYADFFLKLPEIYKNIDFVFRPHPLLFYNLKSHGIWNEIKIKLYLEKLHSLENLVHDEETSYMELFANSDGLIHDCGSFTAEYLFTEKPACYLLNESGGHEEFTFLGENCLDQHYLARSEGEILAFIDGVIIQENDYKKNNRHFFALEKLKINYPHVGKIISEAIIDVAL
jgi:hypothetical protein